MTPENPKLPENPLSSAMAYWTGVAANPSEVLLRRDPGLGLYRTAFGSGVTLLAPGAKIYGAIKSNWPKERGEIAGCDFTLQEVGWIGGYYAHLEQQYGMSGSCMDERLNQKEKPKHGIHKHCGAADALALVTGKGNGEVVEDWALELLEHKGKEKEGLIPGMEHHEVVTVMVTLGPTPYSLNPDKYGEARQSGALPFHTFISIENVVSYAHENNVDASSVFEALMKWNLQIAINIMGGNHNTYQKDVTEQGVLAVIDIRGVDMQQYSPFLAQLDWFLTRQEKDVQQVQIADAISPNHANTIYIA